MPDAGRDGFLPVPPAGGMSEMTGKVHFEKIPASNN